MIRPEEAPKVRIEPHQIPDAVVAAAREAWLLSDVNPKEDWRAAIAAALNAWPGSWQAPLEKSFDLDANDLVIPLPQKPEGRIDQEAADDR